MHSDNLERNEADAVCSRQDRAGTAVCEVQLTLFLSWIPFGLKLNQVRSQVEPVSLCWERSQVELVSH